MIRERLRSSVFPCLPVARSSERGFTLIEILIVISIISLLASFVMVAIGKAQDHTRQSLARTQVAALNQGLMAYVADETVYPGTDSKPDPERNDFPLLYEALFADARPRGRGGRNAPYVDLKEDTVAVQEGDTASYRKATRAELRNPNVKKYILDPWGNPYIYRYNKSSSQKEEWMHKDADIYSLGSNEEDDTVSLVEEGDDIGNW